MSQTTRCPSCATLFKVVPDQLRISDGWVRCGQCKKVFDATLSLQEVSVPVPPPGLNAEQSEIPLPGDGSSNALAASGQEPSLSDPGPDARTAQKHGIGPDNASDTSGKMPPDDPELSADLSPESDETALVLDEKPPHGQEPAGYELPAALLEDLDENWAPDDSEPVAQEPETRSTAEPAKDSDSPADTVGGAPFTPAFTAASSADRQVASELDDSAIHATSAMDGDAGAPFYGPDNAEARTATSAGGLPEEEPAAGTIGAAEALVEEGPVQPSPPALQEPSFVRSARRKALWDRPAVRLVLGAVAVLLAAVLLVQVAVQQRDYLASAQPQWRSALETLCVPLRCTVRPYQHIASVAVDSSSFNKLGGNTYRFALALKNQSALAVALPAVELTLTDTSDQPVLRRVITPRELLAPATLPAAGEWMGSLEMDIGLDGDARISGYRVMTFYP